MLDDHMGVVLTVTFVQQEILDRQQGSRRRRGEDQRRRIPVEAYAYPASPYDGD